MNRKVSYEDYLNFIENVLQINLLAYQKEIIKCFYKGKEVIVSPSENNYNTKTDVAISYLKGMGCYAQTYVDEKTVC